MQVNIAKEFFNKLNSINGSFELIGLFIVIIFGFGFRLMFSFLKKRIESEAEKAVQKRLKEFQLTLDNEHEEFKIKHQKQVNAIHEVYQKFQKLILTFRYFIGYENFSQPLKPKKEMEILIRARFAFKKAYSQNKILFSKNLCRKIETNMIKLDNFIKTYENGLFPESENKENSDLYISGLWTSNEFYSIKENLEKIAGEIEDEFRKVY